MLHIMIEQDIRILLGTTDAPRYNRSPTQPQNWMETDKEAKLEYMDDEKF
jgi:hypothetical protein